jgi:folate-binding protein YgfZ
MMASLVAPTLNDAWHAARERCALIEIAAGFVVLTGSERRAYLHSLATNKVADLEAGEGRRSFALTPTKGRIVADFLACETGSELWLECADGSAGALMELLRKYYFGQEVEFDERSNDWRLLSLQGPESAAALERVGAAVPSEEPGAHAAGTVKTRGGGNAEGSANTSAGGAAEIRVVRWSDTGESGFHLWVPVAAIADVRDALLASGAEPGSVEAWTVLQIEAGIAVFGRELGEETIPLEAPTENAMSFDKGCYPGQEVIARLHVRGRPAKELRGLRIEGDPLSAGAKLDAPDKAGVATVTACGRSPVLGSIALAYVQRDYLDPGTRLTAEGRAAEVVDLPMVPVAASRSPQSATLR